MNDEMDTSEVAAATLDEIDRIARAFVEAGKAPGVAYGLVRDGLVIHGGGAGVTVIDGVSDVPRLDSVFRIASMTKSFTAAAALLLRDAGMLDLDEPVATYVPAVADIPPAGDDAPPLTMRLLLTMSAGFPSDDPWADRQESLTEDAFDAMLRSGPRFVAVPGTEYHYSNLGYAIAGRAVSNVSGQPLQTFVMERLLIPLGMRRHLLRRRRHPRRAVGGRLPAIGRRVAAGAVRSPGGVLGDRRARTAR